jgi:hypothetical protein
LANKNPCGKQVTPEMAYEVWQSPNGDFTTFVLKKYKSPENEAKDPFATWYVATQSPGTFGSFDFGDSYAQEVKRNMILVDNPLCSYFCLIGAAPEQLLALGIPIYHQTNLEKKYSVLKGYYSVAVPKKKTGRFKRRLREFPDIRIVCQDDSNYMLTCEHDVESRKE